MMDLNDLDFKNFYNACQNGWLLNDTATNHLPGFASNFCLQQRLNVTADVVRLVQFLELHDFLGA